jgi:hypothetical protein
MTDNTYKKIGHCIRWALELGILWIFVLPETGPWTTFVLTMLTVGTEWFYFTPKDWSKS